MNDLFGDMAASAGTEMTREDMLDAMNKCVELMMNAPPPPPRVHVNRMTHKVPNPDRRWWQFWRPRTVLQYVIKDDEIFMLNKEGILVCNPITYEKIKRETPLSLTENHIDYRP